MKRDGVWYTFVVVFGDDSAAEGLSCEVGVAGRDHPDLVYLGPVHPARATADEIVSSGACLRLTNEEVKDLASGKGISQASLKAGFDAQLSVSYTVIRGGRRNFFIKYMYVVCTTYMQKESGPATNGIKTRFFSKIPSFHHHVFNFSWWCWTAGL